MTIFLKKSRYTSLELLFSYWEQRLWKLYFVLFTNQKRTEMQVLQEHG